MTDIDIDAIRQREQAATPGPWHPHTTYPHTVWQGSQYDDDPGMISTSLAQEVVADAVFIAAARTDVPALVARVDELTADVERLRNERIAGAKAYLADVERLGANVTELTAALAKSRAQAATYANEIGNLTAENARLRQQRDAHTDVVEAAKAWADAVIAPVEPRPEAEALYRAVDALPKTEATR